MARHDPHGHADHERTRHHLLQLGLVDRSVGDVLPASRAFGPRHVDTAVLLDRPRRQQRDGQERHGALRPRPSGRAEHPDRVTEFDQHRRACVAECHRHRVGYRLLRDTRRWLRGGILRRDQCDCQRAVHRDGLRVLDSRRRRGRQRLGRITAGHCDYARTVAPAVGCRVRALDCGARRVRRLGREHGHDSSGDLPVWRSVGGAPFSVLATVAAETAALLPGHERAALRTARVPRVGS